MPQIVHRPAVFNDEKSYPFGAMLGEEYPCAKNQGNCFYNPENRIEDFFMTGLDFIVGDIAQEFPHRVAFFAPRNPKLLGSSACLRMTFTYGIGAML
jgi:hypothetical protein